MSTIVLIASQKIHSYLLFRTQWVKDFVTTVIENMTDVRNVV